jgi:regulatory protein
MPPPDDAAAHDRPGDPESVARVICLRQLDRRARTRAELAETLRKRGVPDGVAGKVLDRFTEVGLIDDAALAETAASALHRERGLAGRAVAAKLRQRGVDEQTVAAAIEPIDRDSEYAAARALVGKKLRSLDGLEPAVRVRRLVGLLARRGYPPGLSYEVAREAAAPDAFDADDMAGAFAPSLAQD